MENIPLILDCILLLAAHTSYVLADGLELLQVLPCTDTPSTHRYVLRRLVTVSDLGSTSRADLLQLLDRPLSKADTRAIAFSAASADNVRVLDWLLSVTQTDTLPLESIFYYALRHAPHTRVLDWCVAQGGADSYIKGLVPFTTATLCCRLPSLRWLKAYYVQHGLYYAFDHSSGRAHGVPADRQVAVLDWWMADYFTRTEPLFPANRCIPTDLAIYVDNGLLVVDWWRKYCAEMGRAFAFPFLNGYSLQLVIKFGTLDLCQWWWKHSVQMIGIRQARLHLKGALDTICEWGRVDFLDWYWAVCAGSHDAIKFPRNWRPQHPFVRLNVILWWEAKVDSGQVDPGVFDLVAKEPQTKLDALFEVVRDHQIEVAALDWWWARHDRFGMEMRLSQETLQSVTLNRCPELLQWYLDRRTPQSPLPVLSYTALISLVSQGRADRVEQVWQLSILHRAPLMIITVPSEIDPRSFDNRIAVSTTLDYVSSFCDRIGARFTPCCNTWSTIFALNAGDLDVAQWLYAMHRVHGTIFPTAKELDCVKGATSSEMGPWVRFVQGQLVLDSIQ
ncbi:hypothetical protein BC828DRAFT_384225 [Blastocladiella britannica]|nr:hypothetical protein BC828DRAFT_384225 [Blastocladiella britannica]